MDPLTELVICHLKGIILRVVRILALILLPTVVRLVGMVSGDSTVESKLLLKLHKSLIGYMAHSLHVRSFTGKFGLTLSSKSLELGVFDQRLVGVNLLTRSKDRLPVNNLILTYAVVPALVLLVIGMALLI